MAVFGDISFIYLLLSIYWTLPHILCDVGACWACCSAGVLWTSAAVWWVLAAELVAPGTWPKGSSVLRADRPCVSCWQRSEMASCCSLVGEASGMGLTAAENIAKIELSCSLDVAHHQFIICSKLKEEKAKLPPGPFAAGPKLPCLVICCLSLVDGSSLRRSDSCRLKGEDSLSLSKPRKEPCRCSISSEGRGRSTA